MADIKICDGCKTEIHPMDTRWEMALESIYGSYAHAGGPQRADVHHRVACLLAFAESYRDKIA